jgi:hypothetical protein
LRLDELGIRGRVSAGPLPGAASGQTGGSSASVQLEKALDQPYTYDNLNDPPEYNGLSLEDVLLKIADNIAQEYSDSLKPVPIDPAVVNSKMALPTKTVFARGFDPLEGGIAFGSGAFRVFSEWIEVLPTDQVVATEYSLKGL